MPLRARTVEEGQLPRWVYAMMKANQDPSEDSDSRASRVASKMRAEIVYKKRQDALANREIANTARMTGLEWKNRPRTTFTSEELDKIIPTRRASFVIFRFIRISFISSGMIAATAVTVFALLSVCVSLKLGESSSEAWTAFKASPVDYYHHVMDAIEW